jgi:4-hydroxybenzoate polyprenyltransferase
MDKIKVNIKSMLMNVGTTSKSSGGLERLKRFLALSRTPHGLLDMATPAFAVLLYLGYFPSVHVIIIGLMTAFAGYTAVYALNDIVDFRTDMAKGGESALTAESYLDSLMVLHPMAQGLLTYREGILWAAGWSLVALVGAYLLNPMCVVIFLLGAALEIVYCLLWHVSPWRSVVSGFVKNSGPVAALLAVDPHPSLFYVIVLFLGLFFWEIGGQNIPADWSDIELDRQFRAKTIPVQLGAEKAAFLSLAALSASVVLIAYLFGLKFPAWKWVASLSALAAGTYLLLIPVVKLLLTREREQAMALFNRASYFPLTLLCVVLGLIGLMQ